MTSHDVVAIVRRRLATRAVGHTGTLDPFATGLLVLVVGAATRLARFVSAAAKEYHAEARLGVATTTDDRTGEPIGLPWAGEWPSREEVVRAIGKLTGRIEQVPPGYSAKSVAGVRSYRRARAGTDEPLAPVAVVVNRFDLVEYRPPVLRFSVEVGSGTYVRALARDLGRLLGTGAHLTELRRTVVGGFRAKDGCQPDEVVAASVLSPLRLLGEMMRVDLRLEEAAAVRQGRQVGETGAPAVRLPW